MAKEQIIRKRMVQGQIFTNRVRDERILAALEAVPRENFLPESLKQAAYVDEDIQLGNGRFILEPLVFARLLDAAKIQPTDKVMDVACATGYSAAVLSMLAGSVTVIESNKELAKIAEKNLAQLDIKNVKLHVAELLIGANKSKQFDVIFVGGAVEQIPDLLISQLKDGGRLVTVMADAERPNAPQNIVVITKNGKVTSTEIIAQAVATRLREFDAKRGFEF
jgi:protein-L-isoaspartate(D-aspartate) O-methyltransferase